MTQRSPSLFPFAPHALLPAGGLDTQMWRGADGIPERTLHRVEAMEAAIGKPVISSDFALYWRVFRSIGVTPTRTPGALLSTLNA